MHCHCSLYTVRLLSACSCASVIHALSLLFIHCTAVISMQLCVCYNCTCTCTVTALYTLYGCYQHAAVRLLLLYMYIYCHCSLYIVWLLSACSCASVITVHTPPLFSTMKLITRKLEINILSDWQEINVQILNRRRKQFNLNNEYIINECQSFYINTKVLDFTLE